MGPIYGTYGRNGEMVGINSLFKNVPLDLDNGRYMWHHGTMRIEPSRQQRNQVMKGKPYQEHVEFRTTLGVESFRLDANPSVADLVELALQAENELPVIVSATVTLLSHNDGIDGLNYGPAIDDIDISLVNGVREGKRGKRIRMGELTWKDQEWLELECYRELERQGHVFEDIPQ